MSISFITKFRGDIRLFMDGSLLSYFCNICSFFWLAAVANMYYTRYHSNYMYPTLSLSFFLSLRNVGVGTSCSSQPSPKSGFLYVNVIHVWNLICSFAIQYQMVWILQQVQLALKFWFLINATQDRCTFYAIIDQSKIPSAQVLVLMNNTTSTIYLF